MEESLKNIKSISIYLGWVGIVFLGVILLGFMYRLIFGNIPVNRQTFLGKLLFLLDHRRSKILAYIALVLFIFHGFYMSTYMFIMNKAKLPYFGFLTLFFFLISIIFGLLASHNRNLKQRRILKYVHMSFNTLAVITLIFHIFVHR